MGLNMFGPWKRLAIRPRPSPGHLVEGLWAWSLSQWSPQKGKGKSSYRWHIQQKTDFCLAWHPSFLEPDPILPAWIWFPPAHVVIVSGIHWAPRRPDGDSLYGDAPFYRCRVWGTEKRGHLSKMTLWRAQVWHPGPRWQPLSWSVGGGGHRTQTSAMWPGDLFSHSSA